MVINMNGHCPMQASPTVLIVEDELFVRFAMVETLADQGFSVVQAGDAAEALALLEALPDLAAMVSDIEMPGEMNGTQLAREVRELRPDLPIIIISGRYESPPDLPEGVPFLPKPVSDRLLIAML